jgi:3-hydroxybutyryl-CoA dehydrogenase
VVDPTVKQLVADRSIRLLVEREAGGRPGEGHGMEIKKVGVVGCGLMGSGIAEVCARAGYETVVREVDDAVLARGLERLDQSMQAAVRRGKLTDEERTQARGRLRGVTGLDDLADRDLIVEAVTENLQAKQEVFRALDRVCGPETILASNTSSIPIVELASATGRPERVLGMHFMNPVPVMRLIEMVRAITTAEDVLEQARAFGESLGKRVIVSKDRAGFIVNMLLVPYLLEAIRMFESGFASREDIDLGMLLGTNHPMGPLTLLDYVGLDTTYFIATILFDELREPKYAPPPLLKQMVTAGFHGRKSGRGFYNYAAGEEPPRA